MNAIRLVKGSLAVFLGTLLSSIFAFVARVVIARGLETVQYGVLSTSLALVNVATIISMLGLNNALPREIAYWSTRRGGEDEIVDEIVLTALGIVVFSSTLIALVIALFSTFIASFLRILSYAYILRLVSIVVPLLAVTETLVAVSRAYGRVTEKVLIQSIVVRMAWLIGSLIVFFLGWSLVGFILSYIIAATIGTVLVILSLHRAQLLPEFRIPRIRLVKDLLVFSTPLLISNITNLVMTVTDTFMLSIINGPRAVGVYNVAAQMAKFIPALLSATGYLALPLFAEIYAKGALDKLKLYYKVTAKWIYVATYPFAILLISNPRLVIVTIFGYKYIEATSALIVLSIGFMVHVIMGLNGITLIALRKANAIMFITILSGFLNVLLNAVLIDKYSVIGAAIATATAYIVANILTSAWLYRVSELNPFTKDYLSVLLVSTIIPATLICPLIKSIELVRVIIIIISIIATIFSAIATATEQEIATLRHISRSPLVEKIIKILLRRIHNDFNSD